ncbi:hypothetical protein VTK56DRAFT_7268 [Thermocarpiscus australiensis]
MPILPGGIDVDLSCFLARLLNAPRLLDSVKAGKLDAEGDEALAMADFHEYHSRYLKKKRIKKRRRRKKKKRKKKRRRRRRKRKRKKRKRKKKRNKKKRRKRRKKKPAIEEVYIRKSL